MSVPEVHRPVSASGATRSGPVRRSAGLSVALAIALAGAVQLGFSPPAAAEPECLGPSFDFDGDRLPDAVIGSPGGSVGSVQVRLTNEGESRSVMIKPPPGAATFGASVASVSSYQEEGDDALCAQLAVGAPGSTVNGVAGAGAVYLYRWTGDSFALRTRLTQGSNGIPGSPTRNAHFGASVAAEESPEVSPRPSTVAVGAPGQQVGSTVGAGSVTLFTLGATGTTTAARTITQNSAGVPGSPSTRGAFGAAVSVAGTVAAVGAPGQTVGGVTGAGAVYLLGPTTLQVDQNTAGVPGVPEKGDEFGAAVDLVWDPVNGRHRLGIGIPGEDIGSLANAGAVLSTTVSKTWVLGSSAGYDQSLADVAGEAEGGDRFGGAISALPDRGWLVGSPNEDIGTLAEAGMVQTVGVAPQRSWTQDSPGIPGSVEAGDRFGASISAVLPNQGPVIGMPGEDDGIGAVISGLPQYGTVQWWGPVERGRFAFGSAVAR